MRTRHTLILLVAIIVFSPGTTAGKEWRGIIPLHSTRADVERLLGSPSSEPPAGTCACFYDLGDQTVTFTYANGLPCGEPEKSDGLVGGWNVSRDTVVKISIYFKKARKLSEFDVDDTKYKKLQDPEMSGHSYYVDADAGVQLSVGGGTEILSITYFHSAKDYNLRCPTARQNHH